MHKRLAQKLGQQKLRQQNKTTRHILSSTSRWAKSTLFFSFGFLLGEVRVTNNRTKSTAYVAMSLQIRPCLVRLQTTQTFATVHEDGAGKTKNSDFPSS